MLKKLKKLITRPAIEKNIEKEEVKEADRNIWKCLEKIPNEKGILSPPCFEVLILVNEGEVEDVALGEMCRLLQDLPHIYKASTILQIGGVGEDGKEKMVTINGKPTKFKEEARVRDILPSLPLIEFFRGRSKKERFTFLLPLDQLACFLDYLLKSKGYRYFGLEAVVELGLSEHVVQNGKKIPQVRIYPNYPSNTKLDKDYLKLRYGRC